MVTGGGGGLGRLLAMRLTKLGAKVIVWDINQDGEYHLQNRPRRFLRMGIKRILTLLLRGGAYDLDPPYGKWGEHSYEEMFRNSWSFSAGW